MFKYDPNYLSRSERRHQGRLGALPVTQESKAMHTPAPAVPTPYSVGDMMMFSMDPSHRKQTPNLAASPSSALAMPKGRGDQTPAVVTYLGLQRPPTFFARTRTLAPQPQRRIVGFCISDSESSGSDRSSSDSLDCDTGGGYSDLGD